jgi:hypothetical protein
MQIGFIDFSKEERNKILATLSLLNEKTALDELGIGTVRDAYADILFPGISVIQTRAKYLVLIPYLFERAARQKLTTGKEVLRWIQQAEDKLVKTLLENSPATEKGIIGTNAAKQNRTVKMKPSSIYWNALRTFEIVKFPNISLPEACGVTASRVRRKGETSIKSEGETFDDPTANQGSTPLFAPIIPDERFEKDASIVLTHAEALFLEERITCAGASKGSLLAWLIKRRMVPATFDDIPTDLLPPVMKKDYQLAQAFSNFIYGAHLRYNVIFSEYQDDDMARAFETWRGELLNSSFDLSAILNNIRCPAHTGKFCDNFLDCVKKGDLKAMDALLIARERAVKGDRAKLCKPTEYRYDPTRPIHDYKLSFRYGAVRAIVTDILQGLEAEVDG